MTEEKTHKTPEVEEARTKGVKESPVAKVVAKVSEADSKKTPAKAEKEQPSKTDIREEDDEQQLVDEIKRRAEEEHQELASIGDLLFEQKVFAQGLAMGIQISLDNMSGEDAPFTKAQRTWSMQFLNRRLAQLNRDQGAMKDRLDAADDGTKKAYIEARNSDRLRLILMGLGVMGQKKDSELRKIGRQSVMKSFFSYAFQSTIELHGKDSGANSRFSILNQLYSLTLIDQQKKEVVQDFFKSIHMDDLNKIDEEEGFVDQKDGVEPESEILTHPDGEKPKNDEEPKHTDVPSSTSESQDDDARKHGGERHVSVDREEKGVSNNPVG